MVTPKLSYSHGVVTSWLPYIQVSAGFCVQSWRVCGPHYEDWTFGMLCAVKGLS